ncbi:MAG: photosynthetic reaction center cytochrome c subunit family protein [Acidobacteriota bacterium]
MTAAAEQGAPTAAPSFDQAAALAQLRASIAGKEEQPAVEVFKNIKQYKGVTAARFLRIMEFGFTVALGVDCTHCHEPGKWESEEKLTKQIAREMSQMLGAINGEHLKRIPNLRSTNPSVNCTTCHRGQTRPALELPAARPPQ